MEVLAGTGGSTPTTILDAMGVGGSAPADNVRAFWRRVERFAPGAEIDPKHHAARRLIIVSGWACDLRILADGRRQIFSFLLPGDTIEPRGSEGVAVRGVIALTRLELVDATKQFAANAGQADVLRCAIESAGRAAEARLYDHLTRVGRLTAKERVIHLLLELRDRLNCAGVAKGDTFKIPLTQEIFADALGLSVVHINRTLKLLRREGSAEIRSGVVTLRDREGLARAAGYVSPYDAPHWPGATPAKMAARSAFG